MPATNPSGGGGGGITNINVSAGTTSNNLSNLVFSNLNGVTFGLNASTITASVAPGGGGITNINISAGTTSNNLSNVTFSNSNGVSFGLNASTVTASIATSLTNFRVSAGTTSNLLSAITFNNGNGITFGLDASTVTASHNGITSQSNQILSLFATGNTTQSSTITLNASSVLFRADGIVSIGLTNGSIRVSVNAGSISAGTTRGTLGEVVFSNSNGLSFGVNGQTVTASHNGVTSQSNQQMTMFATGNTTQSSTGTTNASSIIFRAEGIASVGITGGSVVFSVPAGAPSPVNFSAGTTSNDLGSVVFSNSNGVSFGLNGSTITASVNAGGGGAFTHTTYAPFPERPLIVHAVSNGSFYVQPVYIPHLSFDRIAAHVNFSNSTNSTGTITVSFGLGIYTRDNTRISRLHSTTHSFTIQFAGAGSTASNNGPRIWTAPWTTTITESQYYLGLAYSTASAGNNASFSIYVKSQLNSSVSGMMGVASTNIIQETLGLGRYTAATTNPPNSIAFSELQGGSSAFRRPLDIMFLSSSI